MDLFRLAEALRRLLLIIPAIVTRVVDPLLSFSKAGGAPAARRQKVGGNQLALSSSCSALLFSAFEGSFGSGAAGRCGLSDVRSWDPCRGHLDTLLSRTCACRVSRDYWLTT
jgi:hypothetical protein